MYCIAVIIHAIEMLLILVGFVSIVCEIVVIFLYFVRRLRNFELFSDDHQFSFTSVETFKKRITCFTFLFTSCATFLCDDCILNPPIFAFR